MARHLYISILTSLLATTCMFGCTTYDDEEDITPNNTTDQGVTNNNNSNTGNTGNSEKANNSSDVEANKIGGVACGSAQECISGVCSNNICGCSDSVTCSTGLFCDTTNVCVEKKEVGMTCSKSSECLSDSCSGGVCQDGSKKKVGDACASPEECASGSCDGRCLDACSSADDCGSNMICDAGTCHSIVSCPGDAANSCFMTTQLTINSSWVGSILSENALAKGDFFGDYYKPVLPKTSDLIDFSMCVTPMIKVLNISLLTATLSEFYQLLYSETDPSAPYVLSIALDHFGETDDLGNLVENEVDGVMVKGGTIFETITKNKSSNVNIVTGLLAAYPEEYRSAAKTKIMLAVGEMMADPRVSGRVANIGCLNLPVQLAASESLVPLRFESQTNGKEARKVYLKTQLSNSNLMTNDSRYVVSIGSSEDIKADTVAAYNNHIDFPINYTIGAYTPNAHDDLYAASSDYGDKTFYFKVNYKSSGDFLCNEYDISSGVCPGIVKLDIPQRCVELESSEYASKCTTITYKDNEYIVPKSQKVVVKQSIDGLSCDASSVNNDSFANYESCRPRVSVNLDKIYLYMQIDPAADAEFIKK